VNFSIFRQGEQEHRFKRHAVIHKTWKKKILYPLMEKLDKYIPRFMVSDIKDIPKKRNSKRKKHRLIKFIWKTKLFLPVAWILNKHIGKFKTKSIDDVPNEIYNRNFRILYFSFEKGIEDWNYNFYGGIKNGKKDPARYKTLETNWKNRHKYHWYKMPKFFLDLLVTICLEDTAYRELVNCIMMRLQGEMNRIWNPEIKHKFPMYISMHDKFINYFIEWMRLQGGGLLKIDRDPKDKDIDLKPGNKLFKLNKEAVEAIHKLNENQQKIFTEQLNKFILLLLGQERTKMCPSCRKIMTMDKFGRSGTTNLDFIYCNECSGLKNGQKPTLPEVEK